MQNPVLRIVLAAFISMGLARFAFSETMAAVYTAPGIKVIDEGVFCDENGTAELRNPDLISNGRIVPARRGTLFGVTVQSERPIPFAEFKMFKPGGKTADVWRSSIGESYAFRGFRFDSRKEIVTGVWRMDAYDGKRLLFSIEFLVVPWHQMPNISSKSCPFEGIDF